MEHLDDAALLMFHRNADPSSSYVTLHDLQRDFAVCKSKDNQRSHSALVEAFQNRHHKLYVEGPNYPSYLRRFMIHHVVGAGMIAEALTLLIDPDWVTHRLCAKDPMWEIVRDYDLGLEYKGTLRDYRREP